MSCTSRIPRRQSSSQAKDGTPKFSLLHYFRDEVLKDLDAAAAKYSAIIRFQWDGAGPHNEAVLLKFLNSEFGKRGWIFDFQASKLPILNVHDACVFPALSKIVSANQALQFDGTRRILEEASAGHMPRPRTGWSSWRTASPASSALDT